MTAEIHLSKNGRRVRGGVGNRVFRGSITINAARRVLREYAAAEDTTQILCKVWVSDESGWPFRERLSACKRLGINGPCVTIGCVTIYRKELKQWASILRVPWRPLEGEGD